MREEQTPQAFQAARMFPLTRLLPNMLTLLSLCSGLTGIRFALQERWDYAVLAIVLAAFFDVLDGRVARMLSLSSKFGAELDSLSDAISFGVAPGLIMYQWTVNGAGGLGWIAVLVFASCCALRLARFNTMLDNHDAPVWAKRYFTGVPAPAGAGLGLLPLMLFLEFGDSLRLPAEACAFWMVLAGGLMVSRLPTFALKGWKIESFWVAPLFVGVIVLVSGLVTNTWLTLSIAGILYVLALPVSWFSYRARAKKEGATP